MSKPITYTFNGFEHTMSAEEVEAIERFGPLREVIPNKRVPLSQMTQAMRARPGIRWEHEHLTEDPKKTIYHADGWCGKRSTSGYSVARFVCQYKIHPDTCCAKCVQHLVTAGRLVAHDEKGRQRLSELRQRAEKRKLKVKAPERGRATIIDLERVLSTGNKRNSTNAALRKFSDEADIDTLSSTYASVSLSWGVPISTLLHWKRVHLISGPRGRVWLTCKKPAKGDVSRRRRASQSVSSAPTRIYHPAPFTDQSGRF